MWYGENGTSQSNVTLKDLHTLRRPEQSKPVQNKTSTSGGGGGGKNVVGRKHLFEIMQMGGENLKKT
jgi:hypothetical protein